MHSDILRAVITAAALALAAPAAWSAAAPAGTVVYAYGQVSAAGPSGNRALARGDQVFSGETLQTVNGRAQVRFTDGGFAALQPNTQYAIDDYSYAGAGDSASRSFFNLVKGGVRFVSGAIGKINRENYRIQTAVATIGIRGSAGRVWTDGRSMEAVCHKDGLFAEQNGRRTDFEAGQGVSCNGSQCSLIETGSTAQSGDTVTQDVAEEQEQAYTQGDEFIAVGSGGAATVIEGVVGAASNPLIFNGQRFIEFNTFPFADTEAFILANDAGTIGGVEVSETTLSVTTIDYDAFIDLGPTAFGQDIQKFIDLVDQAEVALFRSNPAELVEFNQVGDFVWGGFANGYVLHIDGFVAPNHPLDMHTSAELMSGHQVARFYYGPKPDSEPAGVFQATYTQMGDFFASNASGTATGTISNATFDYTFGLNQGSLDYELVLDNGRSYQVANSILPNPNDGFPFLIGGGAAFGDPGSPACHPTCSSSTLGSFVGHNVTVDGRTLPEFAGFSIFISEEDGAGNADPIGGVVGLQATSTQP